MRPKKKGYSSIVLILGAVVALVAAYYCAGAMRAGETIFIWKERMRIVMANPFENYLNAYTVKVAGAFLLTYLLLALMYVTGQKNYVPGREMGSARYADVKKVNRALADLSKNPDDPENIVVPRMRRKRRA